MVVVEKEALGREVEEKFEAHNREGASEARFENHTRGGGCHV